jgi:hypothetical protein
METTNEFTATSEAILELRYTLNNLYSQACVAYARAEQAGNKEVCNLLVRFVDELDDARRPLFF